MTLRDTWIKEYHETNGKSLVNAIRDYKEPDYWTQLKINILEAYLNETNKSAHT
jgi:hypothetical protein